MRSVLKIWCKKHFQNLKNNYFNSRGIALLLVMWVIIILFVIVAEFSFTMRSELNVTRNYKEDIECYYLAVAGVNAAIHELLGRFDNVYRNMDGQLVLEDKSKSQLSFQDPKSGERVTENIEIPPPQRTGIPLGRGFFSYKINDEDGKLNINRVTHVDNRPDSPYHTLRKLLIDSGVDADSEIDIIMDSILDWRDSNSEHHLNGAEDDWYESNFEDQGFDHPYKAKNGPFDSVAELLMVRGFTKEILYGTQKARELYGPEAVSTKDPDEILYTGVYDNLSAFNVGQRVNENTASDELLMAMYPDKAEEMLDQRFELNGRYKDRQISSYYTVISTGYLPNSESQHTVRATIWRRGRGRHSDIRIEFWLDNEVQDIASIVKKKTDELEDIE